MYARWETNNSVWKFSPYLKMCEINILKTAENKNISYIVFERLRHKRNF
jgi:hypothetical protein